MDACEHLLVLVDYDHPHGAIAGVPVAELRSADPARARPVMALRNPRCSACGAALTGRSLGPRTQPGGDLYDERFRWV